jgi:hypothetical protein
VQRQVRVDWDAPTNTPNELSAKFPYKVCFKQGERETDVIRIRQVTHWEGQISQRDDYVAVKAIYTTANGDVQSAWSKFTLIGYGQ